MFGKFLLNNLCVACTLWLSITTTVVLANTSNPARVTPLRPVDSSSPFTFQQKMPDVPNDIARKYIAIDTSGLSTCAIRARDRGIDCWGANDLAQAQPPVTGKFRTLSMGGSVGCALTTANRLLCWGQKNSRPGPDDARLRYSSVSTGEGHVCAIRTGSHAVECWGNNSHGQLNSPAGAFKSISSRTNKSCGLRMNGQLECWGDKAFMSYPRPVGKFKDLSVGSLHGCVVRTDNDAVVCWGNGLYGEDLAPAGRFKSITSGTDHTCGVRGDSTIACWGRNQWGQLDMPSDVRVISLNAGGAQTCALNRSREALCLGSFASGGESSSESANGLQISQNQRVTAQGAGSWAAGVVTKFVGNLFIKWGDASNSETLLFLGGLLGSKSNKETNERFQEMQKQLDALAETLTAVDKKATAILTDIKTLQCDDKLGDLDASVINIRAAMRLYQGTGNPLTDTTSYMAQVRDELTKAQQIGYIPTDLRPSMRKFVTDWHDKVKEDLARIDETLMNANYKTGPLGACLDKAFVAYQNQNGDKQFDDRRIWKGIYWIILKAMADQAMATQMLLDMNKFTAITALSDTAVEPLIPVINEGIEWQEDTLCADVDAHSAQAASNRRWGKALQACEENKSVTRLLYKNLVQQIELAGAPYSDKDVMLSMGADLLGKGSAQDSVLWLRSWETSLPGIRGFHDAWDMRLGVADFAGHGDANVYFSEGDRDNLGTWRSDGNIWTDLYENAKAAGLAPDRINMMADTMSEMDGSPLYSPAIKGVLFWMTGSTYRMNWRVVMGVSGDDAFKDDAKCFVGSGVGKVCSDREFGQLWGSGCYVTNEDYFPSRVTYKACGWASKHKQLMLDYDIGDISLEYWYRPLAQYDTDRYFSKVIRSPHLFPDSTSPVLYRMPVLKTKYRDCTSPMVIANQSKGRENFRTVASNDGNSKALPSRCGTDLDYFIDQMIQRPDVPDLEQLVRKPVYPAGVN